jgi:predicted transcriptional regulator
VTDRRRELLALLVRAEDEGDVPLPVHEVATRLGADPASVGEDLDRLATMDLVAATEHGYRPTITGRELLELDIDGAPLVVDVPDESADADHRHP